jgi:hypothetical protein
VCVLGTLSIPCHHSLPCALCLRAFANLIMRCCLQETSLCKTDLLV